MRVAIVVFVWAVTLATAIWLGFTLGSKNSSLTQSQAESFYYHGAYDECANITIKDTDTGKAINRSPERCSQIIYEISRQSFMYRFYTTPIPTYNPSPTN